MTIQNLTTTVADETAPDYIAGFSDENKKAFMAWFFDGKQIQYSDKKDPSHFDWIDYTDKNVPSKQNLRSYHWRIKPENPNRFRVALVNGNDRPQLITNQEEEATLLNSYYFNKWVTDWVYY